MRTLQKCMALALFLAVLLPGLPTYARPRYSFSIEYIPDPNKTIKQGATVTVNEFKPEDWRIVCEQRSGSPYGGGTTKKYWLTYRGRGSYDYKLTDRKGNPVDPQGIVSKTKITFFDLKDYNNKPFTGHADKTLYCFIEPLNFVPGDLTALQALIQKVQAIKDQIQVVPGKTEDQVVKDTPFFSSKEELDALINALGQANETVDNYEDQEFGKMAQTEIDPVTEKLKKAFKKLKFGSLDPAAPVVPSTPTGLSLRISLYLRQGVSLVDSGLSPFEITIPEDSEILKGLKKGNLDDLDNLTRRLIEEVVKSAPEGYEADEESFRIVAFAYLLGQPLNDLEVRLVKEQEPGVLKNVLAFDIRNGEWVYDRIYGLRMRDGWTSVSDMARAFYQNSEMVQKDYLYAGFVTKDLEPCVILREAHLEKPERWKEDYLKLLEETKADIVVLVVPKVMGITVEHIFPEDTQETLTENVNVPYVEWAALQSSSQFMNLPEIFRTRIQKVNEQGYAFQEIRFYSGLEEVTGVLGAWDWAGMHLGDHTKKECKAKVLYQQAPENRVQAEGPGNVQAQVGAQVQSSAQANKQVPGQGQIQAQIKAQEVQNIQGSVAVAGASMSNRGSQITSALPVTGASDSIFLFLSSAALMAVGILFFKKH